MVAAAVLISAGFASAVEKPRQGEDTLLDTYHKNMARLETNSFGLPLFLESFDKGAYEPGDTPAADRDRSAVSVYALQSYDPMTLQSKKEH